MFNGCHVIGMGDPDAQFCLARRQPTQYRQVGPSDGPSARSRRTSVVVAPEQPTGEEWWADLLADRARKREQRTDLAVKRAFYRLADEKKDTILVACSKCEW